MTSHNAPSTSTEHSQASEQCSDDVPARTTARPGARTVAATLLAAMLTVLSVLAAPAATAAPNGLGTVLTHNYGQSRATIAMEECGEMSMNTDGGRGTQGSCVASLQHWLNVLNGANIPVSGTFDATTRQALINYQVSRGIPGTGVALDKTREQLARDYNGPFKATFPPLYPGKYDPSLVYDRGNITATVYLSRGKSVALASWIDRNAGSLGDTTSTAASAAKCAKNVKHPVACAVVVGGKVAAGQNIDQARAILADPNSCWSWKSTRRAMGNKATNPVLCQVPNL